MSRSAVRLAAVTLAAWESLLSAGRRRFPASPRRILIAHHLLLGDTLMLTPLVAKLRAVYPDAELVMTVPPAMLGLYQGRPHGLRAVAYTPRRLESLWQVRRLRGFDLAIVPGDSRHSWLARALGARWVIATAGDRPAHKNWPVDQAAPYPARPGTWGDMMAELVPGPAPAPYRPADWPAPQCKPFERPAQPYCVLHPGASTVLKHWPAERWRRLAEQLRARGLTVVWSGGPGEQAVVDAIDPEGRHRSYAGALDLPQLWLLLQGAELLVAPDTGVAHLGRLTDTPTVTLFGPGSVTLCGAGEFWRHSPYWAVTVEDFPCRDQDVLFRRRVPWVRRCGRGTDQCRTAACMQALEYDPVQAAVERALARGGRVTQRPDPLEQEGQR